MVTRANRVLIHRLVNSSADGSLTPTQWHRAKAHLDSGGEKLLRAKLGEKGGSSPVSNAVPATVAASAAADSYVAVAPTAGYSSMSWRGLKRALNRHQGGTTSAHAQARAKRSRVRGEERAAVAAIKAELTARNPHWQEIDRIQEKLVGLNRSQADILSDAYYRAHRLDSDSNWGPNLGIVSDAVARAMDDSEEIALKTRLHALRSGKTMDEARVDVLLDKRKTLERATKSEFGADRAATAGSCGRLGRQLFYGKQDAALRESLASVRAELAAHGVT